MFIGLCILKKQFEQDILIQVSKETNIKFLMAILQDSVFVESGTRLTTRFVEENVSSLVQRSLSIPGRKVVRCITAMWVLI